MEKASWPYEGDRVAGVVGATPNHETAMFRVERFKALAEVVKSAARAFDWLARAELKRLGWPTWGAILVPLQYLHSSYSYFWRWEMNTCATL